MSRILLASTVMTVGVTLVVWLGGRDAHADGHRLILTGSSTVAPLVSEIARRFEASHPEVRIDVQMGGSSRGIADTRNGIADIGMVSRSLRSSEDDLLAHPIARDGIALIAHRDTSGAALDDAQVAAVFRGEIRNWSELGGADAPITVINKAEGRSTLEVFLAHFGLENSQIEADVVIGDNEQGIKTVCGVPHSLGYVSIGAAEVAVADGLPLRILPVGGVEATTANVRNGSFPIARELNLVTRGDPGGLARKFIDFARSDDVHDIVERVSLVPLAR